MWILRRETYRRQETPLAEVETGSHHVSKTIPGSSYADRARGGGCSLVIWRRATRGVEGEMVGPSVSTVGRTEDRNLL